MLDPLTQIATAPDDADFQDMLGFNDDQNMISAEEQAFYVENLELLQN